MFRGKGGLKVVAANTVAVPRGAPGLELGLQPATVLGYRSRAQLAFDRCFAQCCKI